jgi:hypothetical protein
MPPASPAAASVAELDTAPPVVATAAERRRPQVRLADLGWIAVAGVETPKQELLALLTLAAEVEHSLLVQYLYAAASLDAEASSATSDLRDAVLTIALQEMAHLVSIENLLLAVGGPDHFHIGRDGLRAASIDNPLPFALEPVSELTLSEFVLVEAPATIAPDLAGELAQLKAWVWKQARIEPHRVGAFYTQVYWLLQPDDTPRGELLLTPDPERGRRPGWHLAPSDFTDAAVIAAHQALPPEWHTEAGPDLLILPVGDEHTAPAALADIARENVYKIMRQGEGVAAAEDSHFERFFAGLQAFRQGGVSVLPLPRTPYVGSRPSEAPVSTALGAEYTTRWARLFDLRYTMLLLDIGLALATPRSSPDRRTLVGWAFVGMRPLLRALIQQLCSPVLAALEPCGPTFGLLHEDLPETPVERWTRYRTLLQQETEVIAALEAHATLAADAAGKTRLGRVKTDSAARAAFVEHHLTGGG